MKVQITHDHTTGGKPCGIETPMTLEDLNYVVAWLQGELSEFDESITLIPFDCVDLLCNYYNCSKIDRGWEQELNLCNNWDTYVCGPMCEERKPFVERCANEAARLQLEQLALEMKACRVIPNQG
jgi:hypothetical protein